MSTFLHEPISPSAVVSTTSPAQRFHASSSRSRIEIGIGTHKKLSSHNNFLHSTRCLRHQQRQRDFTSGRGHHQSVSCGGVEGRARKPVRLRDLGHLCEGCETVVLWTRIEPHV